MSIEHPDEYDIVYGDEITGYRFVYSNHRLNNPHRISQEEIESIEESKQGWGHVPIFVFCRTCDIYMDYNPGNMDYTSGNWTCPSCDRYVRELTVRSRLSVLGCGAKEQINGVVEQYSETYTFDDGDDRYDWSDL